MQALFACSSRQFHVVLESVLKLGQFFIKKVDHSTNYAHESKWKWFEVILLTYVFRSYDLCVGINCRV